MKLALRDQLAEWILAALADPGHEAPVRALVAFARSADADGVARGLSPAERAALGSEEIFLAEIGGVRLRADLAGDLSALRERAERFARALEACRRSCGSAPPGGVDLGWTLCASAALFNTGLFFEVHELLEPTWRESAEPLRTFLQGLIQVAVGFHHRSTGNRRGAIALLEDGIAKIQPFAPEAYGVAIVEFLRGTEAAARALLAGEPVQLDEPSAPRLVVTVPNR